MAKKPYPNTLLIISMFIAITGCILSSENPEIATPTTETHPYSWDIYRPNTLENLIDTISQKDDIQNLKNNDIYLETSPEYQFLSIVHVDYTGDCRSILDVRLTMIQLWMGSFGISSIEEVEEQYLYENGCLYLENSTEYWLPIQNLLLPYIQTEITAGDEVYLYVLWMGVSKIDDSFDYVFLINQFNAVNDNPAGSQSLQLVLR